MYRLPSHPVQLSAPEQQSAEWYSNLSDVGLPWAHTNLSQPLGYSCSGVLDTRATIAKGLTQSISGITQGSMNSDGG